MRPAPTRAPDGTPAPRDASAVVLARHDAASSRVEVYWVRRAPTLSYLGGFHALPGGSTDAGDRSLAVQGIDSALAPLVAAAARELFEETGVLVARGAPSARSGDLASARRALLDRRAGFPEILRDFGASLDAADFLDAGRWVTPPFSPVRFDTRFFLARVPVGQEPEVWPGELDAGEWIAPQAALERWRAGEALLTPPTLHILETLAALPSFEPNDAAARLSDVPPVQRGPTRRIEVRAGIFLVPLLAPTLPPATHTNCYVIGGRELVVVDPGSPEPAEQDALERFLLDRVDEGRTVRAVLLTHHHLDHWAGAARVQERFGVPICADPRTVEAVPLRVEPLRGGDLIELPGLDDTPARRLRALPTPGHTRGHLSFVEETTDSLIAGDMFAGTGTVIIDPPDGQMAAYMDSLERLSTLPLTVILPGHGAPTGGAPEKVAEYVAHRRMREERIHAAVAAGASDLAAIVRAVYTDVPASMHPYAERSALAHLEKLADEGRLARQGDGWFTTAEVT